jgi:6-phosphogluconolactonase (cycloisomerase 2 family)
MTGRNAHPTLWIGTYPVLGQGSLTGTGEGIWRASLDLGSGALFDVRQVVATPAPSYLAQGRNPDLLYAVNEDLDGYLTVLALGGDGLTPLAQAATAGAHPCHLLVDERAGAVVVANYTSGSLAVFGLGPDGLPRQDRPDQLFTLTGCGPHPERQASPHAHYVLPSPSGRHLLVTNLGGDRVHRFAIEPSTGGLADAGIAVHLPAGSGPRHAVFSADGRRLYVAGELDGRLHIVEWDPERDEGRPVGSVATHRWGPQVPQLAHVVRAGGELHVGCRESNHIAVHPLQPDGTPDAARELRLPGNCPRHHAVVGDWLVVAQQEKGGVVVLDRQGAVHGRADIPSPACVLPDAGNGRSTR